MAVAPPVSQAMCQLPLAREQTFGWPHTLLSRHYLYAPAKPHSAGRCAPTPRTGQPLPWAAASPKPHLQGTGGELAPSSRGTVRLLVPQGVGANAGTEPK